MGDADIRQSFTISNNLTTTARCIVCFACISEIYEAKRDIGSQQNEAFWNVIIVKIALLDHDFFEAFPACLIKRRWSHLSLQQTFLKIL